MLDDLAAFQQTLFTSTGVERLSEAIPGRLLLTDQPADLGGFVTADERPALLAYLRRL